LSEPKSPSLPPSAALAAMRQRYLTTSVPRTLEQLREIAALLAERPDAPPVLTLLRRELHRVRGTAGTYGFAAAAALCAAMEERAVTWSAPDRQPSDQPPSAALAELVAALERAFLDAPESAEVAGAAPAAPSTSLEPAGASPAAAVGSDDDTPDVFLIEDDADLARVLEYSLETAGASYRTFASGTEAVAALLALPRTARRPIVLLDIDLPGLDGHSVHERLSAGRPGDFGVVFMTSHSAESEQLRAYRAGAIDFVQKPVSVRVLLAKLPVWRRHASHA